MRDQGVSEPTGGRGVPRSDGRPREPPSARLEGGPTPFGGRGALPSEGGSSEGVLRRS